MSNPKWRWGVVLRFSEFRFSMAALAASSEFREIGALFVACSDRPCAHLAFGFHVGFGVGLLCWCWCWNFSRFRFLNV